MIGQKLKMISKRCLICFSYFLVEPYRIDTAKYCSYKCSAKGTRNRKGTITSSLGRKNMRVSGAARTGKKHNMTKEGTASHIKRMTGNRYSVGRVPSNFKDENVGYRALHRWVEQHKGKPRICSSCDSCIVGRGIHWANKSGDYKRELSDWLRLCAKCHKAYDSKNMASL